MRVKTWVRRLLPVPLVWLLLWSGGGAALGREAAPTFQQAWQEELTDPARRAAVADVTGDGTPRLVLLCEQPDHKSATLLIKKWDGKAFTTEFTAPVAASADKLVVGRFAGAQKPAVIVTEGGLWYWDGKAFAHKAGPPMLTLLGATRLRTGEERVLVSEIDNAKNNKTKTYRIDTTATVGWLIDSSDAPSSAQVSWGDMHGTPNFLAETVGVPRQIAGGGLIGLWDVHHSGGLFLYYPKIEPQLEKQADAKAPAKSEDVIKGWSYYVAFRDALDPNGRELLVTPKLDGPPYDVALTDPKGSGKPGILVLTGNAATGKTRSLYFFTLD